MSVNNFKSARLNKNSNSASDSSSFKDVKNSQAQNQIPHSNLNSTYLKEINLKEITEKFDTEKMKKSLTKFVYAE
jgi:hypothetical protein